MLDGVFFQEYIKKINICPGVWKNKSSFDVHYLEATNWDFLKLFSGDVLKHEFW